MSTFETEAVNSSLVERKIRLRADKVAALNACGQCIAIKVSKLGEKPPERLKLIGLFRISIAPAGDHDHGRLSAPGNDIPHQTIRWCQNLPGLHWQIVRPGFGAEADFPAH